MKAYISSHWLKFTVPAELTDDELDIICKELFGYEFRQFDRLFKSRDAYSDCCTLSELVSVYRKGRMKNAGTTCFDISGTGLDTLGLDVAKLGKFALDRGGNICRIDLAVLDTDNHLPYDQLLECCLEQNFKARVRTKFNRGAENMPDIKIQPIRRILFGSEKSDNYVVIYDRQQTEKLSFPALCIEQRITNRADCKAIIEALLAGAQEGELFAGLLRGKLEFLEISSKPKAARPVASWWLQFLGDVERRKLKRPQKSRNPFRRDVDCAYRVIDRLRLRRDRTGLCNIAAMAQAAQQDLPAEVA